MNYDEPRQVDPKADRPDAGKWRYTRMNDGQVWPLGRCASCDGHDTPEEAREHWRDYLLDNADFGGQWKDTKHPCEGLVPTGGVNISGLLTSPPTDTKPCGKWTDRFASVGPGNMQTFTLCDRHRNRDGLAAVLGLPGDAITSY